MPNDNAAITQKKFLDADGLTYFSRKLNNYPTNEVIEAVINGVQDALDEKMYIEEYSSYNLFPLVGSNKTLYIDTGVSDVYIWNGNSYVKLNTNTVSITNAQIDALFT